jgi:hypothetical protein
LLIDNSLVLLLLLLLLLLLSWSMLQNFVVFVTLMLRQIKLEGFV